MIQKISLKNVAVVDKHNEVLKVWADLKRNNKNVKYNLLTFDTHTDFNTGFRRYISNLIFDKKLNCENFNEEIKKLLENIKSSFNEKDKFDNMVDMLSNDEHIDVAIKCNIIKKAFAITWEDRNDLEDRNIYNITEKCCFSNIDKYISKGLEDDFLQPHIKKIGEILKNNFFEEKYILDIDLDFFQKLSATNPKKKNIFYKLIKNAEIITIALEEDYLKDNVLNRKAENLKAEDLLNIILNHIKSAV